MVNLVSNFNAKTQMFSVNQDGNLKVVQKTWKNRVIKFFGGAQFRQDRVIQGVIKQAISCESKSEREKVIDLATKITKGVHKTGNRELVKKTYATCTRGITEIKMLEKALKEEGLEKLPVNAAESRAILTRKDELVKKSLLSNNSSVKDEKISLNDFNLKKHLLLLDNKGELKVVKKTLKNRLDGFLSGNQSDSVRLIKKIYEEANKSDSTLKSDTAFQIANHIAKKAHNTGDKKLSDAAKKTFAQEAIKLYVTPKVKGHFGISQLPDDATKKKELIKVINDITSEALQNGPDQVEAIISRLPSSVDALMTQDG